MEALTDLLARYPVPVVGSATIALSTIGGLLAAVRTLSAHGTRIAELEAQARRARDYRRETFDRLRDLDVRMARIEGLLEVIRDRIDALK